MNLLKPPLPQRPPDYLVQIEGTYRGTRTPVLGTGVVLARDLILTCRHVVTSRQSGYALNKLTVEVQGEEFAATREYYSEAKTDLAVLKLQPKANQSLPEVERPNWEWPQGKLRQEELVLKGFLNGSYHSAAHMILHKDDVKIQIIGRVDDGMSGGVAECAVRPSDFS